MRLYVQNSEKIAFPIFRLYLMKGGGVAAVSAGPKSCYGLNKGNAERARSIIEAGEVPWLVVEDGRWHVVEERRSVVELFLSCIEPSKCFIVPESHVEESFEIEGRAERGRFLELRPRGVNCRVRRDGHYFWVNCYGTSEVPRAMLVVGELPVRPNRYVKHYAALPVRGAVAGALRRLLGI